MTVWQPYNVMDKMRLYMCGMRMHFAVTCPLRWP